MKYCVIETGTALASLKPKYGTYPDMLIKLIDHRMPNAQFTTVSIINGDQLPDPVTYDGYIIMGSRHSVNDKLPWIDPLKQFIRDVAAASIPQVGICFGHQIMAEALGGKVKPAENGWIAGSEIYQLNGEKKQKVVALAYHQDQIVKLPKDVKVVLSHSKCPYAGLAYKRFPAYSVQFHPEFKTDFMRKLLQETAGKPVDANVAQCALQSLDNSPDSDVFSKAICNALTNSAPASFFGDLDNNNSKAVRA